MPMLLSNEKRLTAGVIKALGRKTADLQIVDTIDSCLRTMVSTAHEDCADLDWTTLSLSVDVVPDIGGSLRVRLTIGAEPLVEDAATILNRALADAWKG